MANPASIKEWAPSTGGGSAAIRTLLEAAQEDIAALRTALAALTAKLDADAGVTDTNFAATCTPPAAKFKP